MLKMKPRSKPLRGFLIFDDIVYLQDFKLLQT
jgi:hypothetical protein